MPVYLCERLLLGCGVLAGLHDVGQLGGDGVGRLLQVLPPTLISSAQYIQTINRNHFCKLTQMIIIIYQ